jgi:hypothetical protein
VQPRLYSTGELAKVADRCGVANTEVGQIGPDPELLYLLTPEPNDNQLDCVTRWANRRNLTLVYVESIEVQPEPTEP